MGKVQTDIEIELDRIAALRRYDVLDSEAIASLDNVTALASYLFKVLYAVVSLVDTDRIRFKSQHGLQVEEVERVSGLCATTITQTEPYVLTDASLDPVASSHPLVSSPFGLRFYAGMPLTTRDNQNIGTLCVFDTKPRQVMPQELDALRTLAALVMDQLELRLYARRITELNEQLQHAHKELSVGAYIDNLTGLANRSTVMGELDRAVLKSRREHEPVSVMMLDIDNFKQINDTYGHGTGDQVLREVARRMTEHIRGSDMLGRIGGEEFLLVMYPCTESRALEIGERLIDVVSHKPISFASKFELDVTMSVGLSTLIPSELTTDVGQLLDRADSALYAAKRAGKNCIRVESGL